MTAYKLEKIKDMFEEITKYAQEHGVDKETLTNIFKQILGE